MNRRNCAKSVAVVLFCVLVTFPGCAAAVKAMVRRGVRGATSAKEVVSDITLTVLPSSVEVRQAFFGSDGAVAAVQRGMTLIDLSGTEPDCAREVESRLREKQAAFLGGTIHASGAPTVVIPEGQFTIAIGGKREIIDASIGFLKDLAQTIVCLPEPWMPKAFKIAVIMYATANNIATAEICSWLIAQGVDPNDRFPSLGRASRRVHEAEQQQRRRA